VIKNTAARPIRAITISIPTRWWAPVLIGVAVLALGLAWTAQDMLIRRDKPHLALLLFVIAGGGIGLVAPIGEVWLRMTQMLQPRVWRWWPVIPLALAVGVIGCLDVIFRHPIFAWGFLVAIIGLAVGSWMVDPPEGVAIRSLPEILRTQVQTLRSRIVSWRPGREFLILSALLAITFFVRVWQWDSVPPGTAPDEPWWIIDARNMIEESPDVIPFDTPHWRMPAVHQFFGTLLLFPRTDPQLALLLLGAIPGTIAIAFFYLLMRQAYGTTVAIAATSLLALNRWAVLFTRNGGDFGVMLLMTLAGMWFMLRGMQTGRLIWFVLVGIACGVNLIYLYIGSLVVFWIALAWLLLRRMGALSTRDSAIGLVVSGFTAFCVFLPRAFSIARRPEVVSQSSAQLAPWAGQGSAFDVVWNQLKQGVLAFGFQSGGEPWLVFADHGPAMFDALSAALATMGVGYFIWRIREPWARFWLITGALAILISAASTGPGAYNWRLVMSIPPLMAGAGLVLVGLARRLTAPALRFAPFAPLHWVPIAIALVLVGFSTYRDFFVAFRERESLWISGAAHSVQAARWLRERSDLLPSTLVTTTRDIGTTAGFLLLRPVGLGRTTPHVVLEDLENVPLAVELAPGVDRIWIMSASEPFDDLWLGVGTRGIGERARRYYPEGQERLVMDPINGRPLFYVHELTREQVQSKQGLTREPDAQCIGSSVVGGWSGMVYVASPGSYRLASEARGLCATVDLVEKNAFSDEVFLSRGWHPIVLTGTGRELPQLNLVSATGAVRLPSSQMYAGSLEPIGFEVTFSESPDSPPVSQTYLTVFDRNWAAYKPTASSTFYMQVRGTLELPRDGAYGLRWLVAGPTEVLIDGEVVATTDSEEPVELWTPPRQYASGPHSIEVKHHARRLITTWARIFPPGEQAVVLDINYISPP
jgi:4-amino-4-deoxy-L-arabinose transferase-like glycosyltransferase